MSLFETLKKAIFYNPMARGEPKHTSPASSRPASTGRVTPASKPAAPTASASTSQAPSPPKTAPAAAGPNVPAQEVDVEEVLEAMSAKSGQKLNWRTSIVDLMKLVGLDSSLENRKELAAELGYTGDTSDSAAMNIWLHKAVMKKLAQNGGKVPASLQ